MSSDAIIKRIGDAGFKRRDWLVSYHAGWSIMYGEHTAVFFAKETLDIFAAKITGFGPSVGYAGNVPVKRVDRMSGDRKVSDAYDKAVEGNNTASTAKDLQEIGDAKNGWELYEFIKKAGSSITAEVPFTINEFEASFGSIMGFEANIMVTGAQIYWISAHNDFRYNTSSKRYFTKRNIYNLNGGSVGLSLGEIFGKWSIIQGKFFNMYYETVNIQDPNARPFRSLPVENGIQELRSAGSQ